MDMYIFINSDGNYELRWEDLMDAYGRTYTSNW